MNCFPIKHINKFKYLMSSIMSLMSSIISWINGFNVHVNIYLSGDTQSTQCKSLKKICLYHNKYNMMVGAAYIVFKSEVLLPCLFSSAAQIRLELCFSFKLISIYLGQTFTRNAGNLFIFSKEYISFVACFAPQSNQNKISAHIILIVFPLNNNIKKRQSRQF